jgi:hypothetical protein
MTTEIPQKLWKAFCERLKEWHRGAVSIRWIQPNGASLMVVENAPLKTIVFQTRENACSDVMTIETDLPDERPAQHQIIEPIRLVLRQNDESGRYKQLEILAETGKTEITFSPGIDSAFLAKLAA